MVRAMADGHERSAAARAKRDARRREAQAQRTVDRPTPVDAPLLQEVRAALDTGQPLDLLALVSVLILATSPALRALPRGQDEQPPRLEELVTAFIGSPAPETTALLAVLSELVLDDDALRDRCRVEVAAREDGLPRWLAELSSTRVHDVARMAHVLGDADEFLVGVRLADGQEITCGATVDHQILTELTDAFFVPESVATVLAVAKASNVDPDISFDAVDAADARVELTRALERHAALPLYEESDTWPACRALVRWLITLMPAGGADRRRERRGSGDEDESFTRFLATPSGLAFATPAHRALLAACASQGTGDPLRWSAARLRPLLSEAPTEVDVPLDVRLALPELLREYVPFAHAQSGIRQELTAEALAAVDEMADDYRAAVLADAADGGGCD